jgi:hypothetical protein
MLLPDGPVCRLVGSWLKVSARSPVRHQLSVSPSLEAQPPKWRLPSDACLVASQWASSYEEAVRNHSQPVTLSSKRLQYLYTTIPSWSETQYRFQESSYFRSGNTGLYYQDHQVNGVQGNNTHLFWKPYETHSAVYGVKYNPQHLNRRQI